MARYIPYTNKNEMVELAKGLKVEVNCKMKNLDLMKKINSKLGFEAIRGNSNYSYWWTSRGLREVRYE